MSLRFPKTPLQTEDRFGKLLRSFPKQHTNIPKLQARINATLAQLAIFIQRLQEIVAKNERLNQENNAFLINPPSWQKMPRKKGGAIMLTTERIVLQAEFHWEIERGLWERLTFLAQKRGEAIESVITDALRQYLAVETAQLTPNQPDPLIGFFEDDVELATCAEEILAQELHAEGGWSWKK